MSHLNLPDPIVTASNNKGRRKTQRSGSFCELERSSAIASLPKRSQSFRSCLKKPLDNSNAQLLSSPNSGCSSRRSSGSKAVMFTDEVGDTLVEVKKYDETEPIMTPEPDEESIMDVVEDSNDDIIDMNIEDFDENFNDVENVRYINSIKGISATRARNLNLKIFGNPNIKKSQSVNSFKPQSLANMKDNSPECPKNSPFESLTSTPICSPVTVHKSVNSMESFHLKNIEKSQSFCLTLPPIKDENQTLADSTNSTFKMSKPIRKKLSLTQPEIILTSPLDSPIGSKTENISKKNVLNSSLEKLSEKLIQESIETVVAMEHHKKTVSDMMTNESINKGQRQSRRRSSSTLSPSHSSGQPPPPPTTPPPPLPSKIVLDSNDVFQ